MIDRIKKQLSSHHVKSNLLLVITAGVLLEMISGVQYYLSHSLLEEELEKQAETELTLKSIIASSSRNTIESALLSHMRDIMLDMPEPDSMFSATKWLVKYSKKIAGGGIAFVPDYYPQKGRLFEPYTYWKDGELVTTEISSSGHDYTQSAIFKQVIENDLGFWSRRYHDSLATDKDLISYCLPIHDKEEKTVAVLYMDIDTEWLGDTLNSRHLFPSSFDFLLTKEGELVAGPREEFVSKSTLDYLVSLVNDSTVVKRKSEKRHCRVIEFRHPDSGEKGQLFISHIKGHHRWQVAVACYDKEVFGNLRKMRLTGLLLMAAAFIILAVIINRAVRNNKRLQKAEMEKRRIDSELQVANRIQQSMLPHHSHQQDNIDIYGSLVPAREVGGDLYDYFIRDEKLFFCIGDVSGKGPASAMLMAVTRALFRSASAHESNPSHIMQAINETICQGNESNMFVTMYIGVLDLPTGRLRYCDAGHDTPIIMHHSPLGRRTLATSGTQECVMLHCNPHLPIGVFDDMKYNTEETLIEPGTTIFLYTDGLTEAKDEELKQFGLQRVKQVLTACAEEELVPKDILETVMRKVHEFVNGAEQSDDLTLLCIHYTPVRREMVVDEQLTLQNDVRQTKQLNAFVKQVLEGLHIEKSLAKDLQLAVEEAVVNVMEYAYPTETNGDITIRVMSDGCQIEIMIIDSGIFFDPTAKVKTDLDIPIQDRQIGGLGILLVRELMDSINYERSDGKNVLTLIKKIGNS